MHDFPPALSVYTAFWGVSVFCIHILICDHLDNSCINDPKNQPAVDIVRITIIKKEEHVFLLFSLSHKQVSIHRPCK